MYNQLQQLKDVLYHILQGEEEEDNNIQQIYQNMGIQMTRAVQKEGVNIIQVQSVVGRIVNGVVSALKLVDEMQMLELERQQPLLLGSEVVTLPQVRKRAKRNKLPDRDTVIQVLNETDWVVEKAAQRLGVHFTTLHRWIRKENLKRKEVNEG